MRVVVTGCAGMIGSHLTEALLRRGDRVVGVDNFLTGQAENLAAARRDPRFELVQADVCDRESLSGLTEVDAIVHLASPASPADFTSRPDEILRVGSLGTFNVIDAAQRHDARLIVASTSEVYGEPRVHPQPESYTGNVNTVGPRACYDESKRFMEAAVSTWSRSYGLDAGIARIFNTYGPRMRIDDGRVVSNFVVQALRGDPLTVQGDGLQTRSFCYVDDQVDGLIALLDSTEQGPLNIGNPSEFTVLHLAKTVIELTGSPSSLEYRPLPADDPTQRQPDISAARDRLGWEPRVPLLEGLPRVIEYFSHHLDRD